MLLLRCFILLSLCQLALAAPPANTSAKVAIIIDDIGYSLAHGQQAATLPGPVTLAVLPRAPNSLELAQLAARQGKEVMLHAPMSNTIGKKLDAGALTGSMDKAEFLATLRSDISHLPNIIGVNNHMGSLLTQQSEPMQWLMAELKRQGLFFIDSRTSADSIAYETARETQLPSLKRDVFLDNKRDLDYIEGQLQQLLEIAHRRGYAVGIGHPYPETLAVLKQRLPELQHSGIELVPISTLLPPMQQFAKRGTTVTTTPTNHSHHYSERYNQAEAQTAPSSDKRL